jgi:hypothetical protein
MIAQKHAKRFFLVSNVYCTWGRILNKLYCVSQLWNATGHWYNGAYQLSYLRLVYRDLEHFSQGSRYPRKEGLTNVWKYNTQNNISIR